MIPLHDDNPTRTTPVVTIGLIAVNALIFFWEIGMPERALEQVFYTLGLVPALLFRAASLRPDVAVVAPEVTIVTSMFLHGGWMHLIGNMLYLWIFGNNVEDAMGHVRFIIFYVLCGTVAALAQALQDPSSTEPMVGASGAIGGVLGAYLVLHPRARVLVLIPIFFLFLVRRIPAVLVLGVWFILQFLQTSLAPPEAGGGVAYWAHIGGFLAGMILIFPFRQRGVVLLDQDRPHGPGPWSRPPARSGPWGRR